MWRLGSARISNEKVWFNMCKCIAAKNSWTWGNNDDQWLVTCCSTRSLKAKMIWFQTGDSIFQQTFAVQVIGYQIQGRRLEHDNCSIRITARNVDASQWLVGSNCGEKVIASIDFPWYAHCTIPRLMLDFGQKYVSWWSTNRTFSFPPLLVLFGGRDVAPGLKTLEAVEANTHFFGGLRAWGWLFRIP